MGHHQERGAHLGAQLQHQVLDALGGMGVQVASRLVEHHQAWVVDQGAGDGHALALAAGQFSRLVLQAMAQADALQQRLGTLAGFRDGGLADQQRHAHVFQGREFRQQVVELVHKAE